MAKKALKAKVWNDHSVDHKEKFKGDLVLIPAGKCIEMPVDEAYEFRGQFFPPVEDADGGQDPRSFKKIRVEEIMIETNDASPADYRCQACAFSAVSKRSLEEHIDDKHLEQMQDKELADKRVKERKTRSA